MVDQNAGHVLFDGGDQSEAATGSSHPGGESSRSSHLCTVGPVTPEAQVGHEGNQ